MKFLMQAATFRLEEQTVFRSGFLQGTFQLVRRLFDKSSNLKATNRNEQPQNLLKNNDNYDQSKSDNTVYAWWLLN